MSLQTAAFTAATQATDPVAHNQIDGDIAFTILGTFVATIDLQISLDGGVSWESFATTYTAPGADSKPFTFGVLFRLYCSAYTSGTANVKIL